MFLFSKPCHVLNFLAFKDFCFYMVCSYIKKLVISSFDQKKNKEDVVVKALQNDKDLASGGLPLEDPFEDTI